MSNQARLATELAIDHALAAHHEECERCREGDGCNWGNRLGTLSLDMLEWPDYFEEENRGAVDASDLRAMERATAHEMLEKMTAHAWPKVDPTLIAYRRWLRSSNAIEKRRRDRVEAATARWKWAIANADARRVDELAALGPNPGFPIPFEGEKR